MISSVYAAFDQNAQGAGQGFSGFGGFGGQNGGYREFHFEGGNMDDIFGDLFGDMFHGGGSKNKGGFGGFHSQGFGNGGFGGRSYQSKGQDIHTEISVSFDEAAFGCDKMIRLQKEDGSIQTLQVHIPEGMEDGKSIRLRGKGAPGMGGGQPGDLFMKVHVGTRPGFERKGVRYLYDCSDTVYYSSFRWRGDGRDFDRTCTLQDPKRNPVRFEDPSERKRSCFHESAICTWRSVCDSSDSGSDRIESGGGAEASGIRGSL